MKSLIAILKEGILNIDTDKTTENTKQMQRILKTIDEYLKKDFGVPVVLYDTENFGGKSPIVLKHKNDNAKWNVMYGGEAEEWLNHKFTMLPIRKITKGIDEYFQALAKELNKICPNRFVVNTSLVRNAITMYLGDQDNEIDVFDMGLKLSLDSTGDDEFEYAETYICDELAQYWKKQYRGL